MKIQFHFANVRKVCFESNLLVRNLICKITGLGPEQVPMTACHRARKTGVVVAHFECSTDTARSFHWEFVRNLQNACRKLPELGPGCFITVLGWEKETGFVMLSEVVGHEIAHLSSWMGEEDNEDVYRLMMAFPEVEALYEKLSNELIAQEEAKAF